MTAFHEPAATRPAPQLTCFLHCRAGLAQCSRVERWLSGMSLGRDGALYYGFWLGDRLCAG